MKFHGLFIGIDRYSSPRVNWLSCAVRDAVALHALFADNFGEGGVLLTDAQATGAAIRAAFERLESCAGEDLVVIAFSGHGTEAHQLVTHDTDPRNLDGTTIPLDTLAEWFARIPANRVVCFLDCCFSGGMGAKALQVDAVSRDLASTETLLERLGGEGRLILTATLPTEKAWEIQRLGHGLLTYHLLGALQGADEIRENGVVGTYRLLDYVTQRVIASAAEIGREQHPTMRGTIDRDLGWPRVVPGAYYQAAFPDRSVSQATEDVTSLRQFGFPPEIVGRWSEAIPSLNSLQLSAINEFGLLQGSHLLVSAPTSSGKTMLGELAGVQGALQRRRALFLFPLKALVNDKLKHFERTYSAYGIRTIRATGDSTSDDIVPLMRGQYDICLMTYEKFAALTVANPHLLEQAGTVVVDEVQMVADRTRGINLEFVLTLLRMQRRYGVEPQLVALSAVIGKTNGFETWLGARLLKRSERPVPLDEGIIGSDGTWRYIASDTGEEHRVPRFVAPLYSGKNSSQDIIKPLVQRLVGEGKQVIVFRETRGLARGCANYLAGHLGLPPVSSAVAALPSGDPSQVSAALRDALSRGVAFHISDLDPDERALVEDHFRARPAALRVIAATTTLAMGINTPAEAVLIAGLKHPSDEDYSVAEYKNMVGRAGRLGFSERGASFLVAMSRAEEEHFWRRYVVGSPEDLESRFVSGSSDPRSIVLRVLVAVPAATRSHSGMKAAEVWTFLDESFGASQQRAMNPTWEWRSDDVLGALAALERHGLLQRDEEERYHPTELGRFAGEAGVEVESVVRIADALRGNAAEAINDPTLVAATQLSVELDNVLFPINKKSTQKEPQVWRAEVQRQGVPSSVLNALSRNARDAVQVTLRSKKAVGCLLWITDQPLAQIEKTMTQFGGAFEAAGAIRSVRARTCDILPITARIAEILHPALDLSKRLPRLLARLEIGVPGDLYDLARLLGTRLSRGDYLRLRRAGLGALEALVSAPDMAILECVDGSAEKLALIRESSARNEAEEEWGSPTPPSILPDYTA